MATLVGFGAFADLPEEQITEKISRRSKPQLLRQRHNFLHLEVNRYDAKLHPGCARYHRR